VNSSFYLLKTNPMMDDKRSAGDRPEALAHFVFGVSGHRDLVPETLPELREQIRTVFDRFRAAYPNASHELLSPLAEGADRAAAEVALSCGIKLIVPLPMAQSEYERDFATPESLNGFRRLLAAADSCFEVRSNKIESGFRADKYAAVGDYIARQSHVLILLWDGRDNKKIGGTAWVKRRREAWVDAAKRTGGHAPPLFGYVGTIQIVTPRLTSPERCRIEIIGELPCLPKSQADERSRL
jgi:hypothetical protein